MNGADLTGPGAGARSWVSRIAAGQRSSHRDRDHRIGQRDAVLDTALILLVVLLVAVPVWPGIFTVDSQAIYRAATEGRISTWYSPALGWLWGVADHAGMPPGGVLIGALVLVVTALLAIYRLVLGRRSARVATAATILWPPVYGLLAWVGRDVWFLAFLLSVLALLGWAAKLPQHRRVLLAVAGVPAWLALDSRQNGFPVLAIWGGTAAWLLVTDRRWQRAVSPVAAVLAVSCGVGLQAATRSVIVSTHDNPQQWLQYRDLLSVSLARDESQLPESLFPSQDLEAVRLRGLPDAFAGPDPLVAWNPYQDGAAIQAQVAHAWWTMVKNHPLDYLRARARFFVPQLMIGHPARSAYFGWSDELDWERSGELRQSFPTLNRGRLRLLTIFEGNAVARGGPLHVVWLYVLLGIAASLRLAFVSDPTRTLGISALLLQVTLQIGIFFFAPTVQYRYQLFQLILGIAMTIGAAATLRRPATRRSRHELDRDHRVGRRWQRSGS